jgi:hypothetical protein
VQRKQRLALELRGKMDSLSSQLSEKMQELVELKELHPGTWCKYGKYTKYDCGSEVKSQQSIVSSLQSQPSSAKSRLKAALKPPEPVVQPLPQEAGPARRCLFFLHMPAPLRSLACLSFLAQQLLLPAPMDEASTKAIQVGTAAFSTYSRCSAGLMNCCTGLAQLFDCTLHCTCAGGLPKYYCSCPPSVAVPHALKHMAD